MTHPTQPSRGDALADAVSAALKLYDEALANSAGRGVGYVLGCRGDALALIRNTLSTYRASAPQQGEVVRLAVLPVGGHYEAWPGDELSEEGRAKVVCHVTFTLPPRTTPPVVEGHVNG